MKKFSQNIILTSLARILLVTLCLLIGIQGSSYAINATDEQLKGVLFPLYSDEACSGPDCGCSGLINLAGNGNAEKIWNFFTSKGFPAHQAAGIMGNMKAESGLEPRLVQYGKTNSRGEVSEPGQPSSLDDTPPTGATTGYGLVQFTPGTKIIPASQRLNMPPGDIGFQLTLINEQLNGESEIPEKAAGDHLRATTTVEEASKSFEYKYERHAVNSKQEGIRIGFAREFLVQFGSGTSPSSTGESVGCGASLDGCPTEPVPQTQTVEAHGIHVHPCIAGEVDRIIDLAAAQGLSLDGDGWVSAEGQITKRENNGCAGRVYDKTCKGNPPTATPGASRHERGTAIDFRCDGTLITARSSACFTFLRDNTSLKNLPSEEWHWSVDGR